MILMNPALSVTAYVTRNNFQKCVLYSVQKVLNCTHFGIKVTFKYMKYIYVIQRKKNKQIPTFGYLFDKFECRRFISVAIGSETL